MNGIETPKTLMEAMQLFADKDVAFVFAKNLRWPNGVACPFCGSLENSFLKTRKTWECKACHKQFSIKKGSIFEDSPIGYDKWLIAMWLIANAKNGISSYELHRALGVTQKSAWFMLHRIRLAMQNGTVEKLEGRVEADETYVGGKVGNMHPAKRKARKGATGGFGKTAVFGMLERGGKVRTQIIKNADRKTLKRLVMQHVDEEATLYTDAHSGYDELNFHYQRYVIEHAEAYVRGCIHTNGIENFWSLLKRTLSGTYVSVEPTHLFRYLDEQMFRFNNRKDNDSERFLSVVSMIAGKRLTYAKLTGKELVPGV